ncbi:AzlC family ABC transporter permease [Paenirhodobacter populi]|uniref:Branched-chain amino acid ABC transporter permease n=1 Tax=Paenirhodobacter populi TaxID=2306993 RepID=A0A443JHY7_9RHOB|nr:AzlC family ABC transporter permease [Sinirhodobacter populi]RWR20237.1 branched-chain amino acid ABC transporter permease [Sinirhodobacter populi]
MASITPISHCFWRGARNALPFLLVILPFGALFGVAATDAGLDLAEVMGFSILVLAGASQFTALQLMNDHAPAFMVIVTSLAVNLRMAMYSVSLAPHLGRAAPWHRVLIAYLMTDQSFGLSQQEYERAPAMSLPQKVAYFLGACLPTCLPWSLSTLAGALAGKAIPEGLALDFAVPVTFLAMIAPGLRSVPHLAAAAVSVIAALALSPLPTGTGLLLAALLAMWTGATVERLLERRNAA